MKDPLRIVIVDDEKLARDRLHGFLAPLDEVAVVGEAPNGPEAVELIRKEQPDLVFLDVQMPGMTGFDVLRELETDAPPQVVFATAHDEYAIKAFEVEAVDYLLKPFGRARVKSAVDRARNRATSGSHVTIEALLKRLESSTRKTTQIPVHSGKRILLVRPDDVCWFGVEHRLVYAHLADRGYMTNFTLRDLEEQVDPETFFRAHKASLVNLSHVQSIIPWFGGRVKLVMNDTKASEIEVSRAQARALRSRLKW